MTALAHTLVAFNTATASENKMHDDEVAGRFGFTGGLVPGVDVFGYLAHLPLAQWGRAWLTAGGMHARFLKPVYDGDEATAAATLEGEDAMTLSATARGTLCATGSATRREGTSILYAIADPAALAVVETLAGLYCRPPRRRRA